MLAFRRTTPKVPLTALSCIKEKKRVVLNNVKERKFDGVFLKLVGQRFDRVSLCVFHWFEGVKYKPYLIAFLPIHSRSRLIETSPKNLQKSFSEFFHGNCA